MKKVFNENKKTYIFFGISLIFYHIQDILSLSLQVRYVEVCVIMLFIAVLCLLASFLGFLIITIKAKLKNPAIVVGVLLFFSFNFVFSHFFNETRAQIYFQSYEEKIKSLVSEVKNIENDNESVRILNNHPFVTICRSYSSCSNNKTLDKLMDTLQINNIKKHPDYLELSVSGYSGSREKDFTIFHTLNDNGEKSFDEIIRREYIEDYSDIDDN